MADDLSVPVATDYGLKAANLLMARLIELFAG